jgi:hypothetical protein
MTEIFVGGQFGTSFGQVAGWIVTGVFGLLLLSAVNTAIVDLIAISFLMARDEELLSSFEKLNGLWRSESRPDCCNDNTRDSGLLPSKRSPALQNSTPLESSVRSPPISELLRPTENSTSRNGSVL